MAVVKPSCLSLVSSFGMCQLSVSTSFFKKLTEYNPKERENEDEI